MFWNFWKSFESSLSKSELVKILLMQLVKLYLIVKLIILSFSTKWNGKIYVTKWISKG